jgi:hypothetical protein
LIVRKDKYLLSKDKSNVKGDYGDVAGYAFSAKLHPIDAASSIAVFFSVNGKSTS